MSRALAKIADMQALLDELRDTVAENSRTARPDRKA